MTIEEFIKQIKNAPPTWIIYHKKDGRVFELELSDLYFAPLDPYEKIQAPTEE